MFILMKLQLHILLVKNTYGMHLDEKLNFNHHIKEKIDKANNGVGLIRKLARVTKR